MRSIRRRAPFHTFLAVALLAAAGCANRAPELEVGQSSQGAFAPGLPQQPPSQDGTTAATGAAAGAPAAEVSPGSDTATPTPGGAAATAPATPSGTGAATAGPKTAAGQSGSAPKNPQSGGQAAPQPGRAQGRPGPAPVPGQPQNPLDPAKYDQGANDQQIIFGSISSMSGVVDVVRPEPARAYFKYINDKGGVNGRKLGLRIYDDQWDVTRHAALARQAFEQDKVFAFTASMGVLTSHGAVPYVEQNKIPVIGGDGVDVRAWGVSPYYYTTTELEALYGGWIGGRWAIEQGCKKVAAQSYNVDESRVWAKSFLKGLQEGGVKGFAYEGENSLAETDFTAYAVQIKQAGADCVTAGQFDSHATRLAQALKQVGHKVLFIQPSTFYSPLTTQSGLFEGAYGIIPTDIVENAPNNPGMAEFLDVVTKYEPAMRGRINGWGVKAYSGAQVAVEAVRRAGNNLTRENIIKILDGMTNLDIATAPPISFKPGKKDGQKCANLVQVKEGKFVSLKRWLCV